MPQKHPTLWHLREQHGLTRELITAFREKAIERGEKPTAVLVRLMTEYLQGQQQAPDTDAADLR
jgi:hypothetical protein